MAARALSPRELGGRAVLTLDTGTALVVADALGFERRAVLLLLPAIEAGLLAARDGPFEEDGETPA